MVRASGPNGAPDAPVDLGTLMTQILQSVRQGNHPDSSVGSFARRNKDFVALGGKGFNGDGGPLAAEAWLQQCEKIFDRMELTEVQKQELATHQLHGAAGFWWNALVPSVDLGTLTWVAFRGHFEGRFVPEATKEHMVELFAKLEQGEGMSVTQYVNRFHELSRFAPHLVDTDLRRNKKFIRGLLPHLRLQIFPWERESFTYILDLALRYESEKKTARDKEKMQRGEPSRGNQQFGGRQNHPYRGNVGRRNQQPGFRARGNHPRGFRPGNRGGQFQDRQQGGRNQQFPALPPVQQALALPAPPPGPEFHQGRAPPRCFQCGSTEHLRHNCLRRGDAQGRRQRGAQAFAVFPGPDHVQGN